MMRDNKQSNILLSAYNKNESKRYLFTFVLISVSFFFIGLLPVKDSYAEEAISVATANIPFLMENAPQAKIASVKLKEKFLPQELKLAKALDVINKLETELKNISPSSASNNILRQKERELRSLKRTRNRSLQDFREELRFARDTALDKVQKEVFTAIDKVRELKKIDIILQDYISASSRVDITPLVLDYLNKKLEKKSVVSDEK